VKIPLTSGAYSARSIIANAQRAVNLFAESNPSNTNPPVPVTQYQRPGKKLLGAPPVQGPGRGLYRATNGDLYCTVNDVIYFVNDAFVFTAVGNIGVGSTIVSMADNGEDLGNQICVVDGTVNGWTIAMDTRAFAPISDMTGTFVGANRVDYLQSFFLFNAPGTPFWYISLPDSVTFNALDVASKASYADNIQTLGVRQREVWLIGELTTEPWYLSGAADFPFEAIASTFVSYGCIATYSMVPIDVSLFWLGQDLKGQGIVVKSDGYNAKRISTHAIEQELQSYPLLSDAVAGSFQMDGHLFYVLSFPTADKTWVYDLATEQWSQWTWTDNDGIEHRDRCPFYAHAYNKVIGQDWQTGLLYEIDTGTYTDNGDAIFFRRGFPHLLNEMKRMTHWSLTVDIQCGTTTDPGDDDTPQLNMRYSDDRGATWSDPVMKSFGKIGQYEISPQYTRLGQARDRVYEVFWTENIMTALNGLYLEAEQAES
jgi:hypothetical protein